MSKKQIRLDYIPNHEDMGKGIKRLSSNTIGRAWIIGVIFTGVFYAKGGVDLMVFAPFFGLACGLTSIWFEKEFIGEKEGA